METETAACCCAERGVEVQGCQEHSQEGAGHRGGGAWRQQQQAPAGTDVLQPVPSLLQCPQPAVLWHGAGGPCGEGHGWQRAPSLLLPHVHCSKASST